MQKTEPTWEANGTSPAEEVGRFRTPDEERVLTDLARNYLTGRLWLCRFMHACIAIGITIGTLAAGWDHLTAALERIAKH